MGECPFDCFEPILQLFFFRYLAERCGFCQVLSHRICWLTKVLCCRRPILLEGCLKLGKQGSKDFQFEHSVGGASDNYFVSVFFSAGGVLDWFGFACAVLGAHWGALKEGGATLTMGKPG